MADRADEIVKAMNVLMERARELTDEHATIVREFHELQQELQALKQNQSAKRKAS
jgi:prefoldin subunit 5